MGGIKIAVAQKIIFGQMGLVKLTSIVGMTMKWKGAVTCREYEFRKEQPTLWVDARDAKDMLARRAPTGEGLFE